MNTLNPHKHGEDAVLRTMRDFILETSTAELNEIANETKFNLTKLASTGREAVRKGINEASQRDDPKQKKVILHKCLSSLVIVLRRRDRLNEGELAAMAEVDESEIQRIERDPDYLPSPRTIYKLEQALALPSGVLAKLSGAITTHFSGLEDRAQEFAANAKTIGKLTAAERRLLTEFVRFLADKTE